MKFISSLFDIGRDISRCSPRPIDFYTKSLDGTRELMGDRAPYVYGNVTDHHHDFISYRALIDALGADRFDRLERIRCRGQGGSLQTENSWYFAVTLSKLILLEKSFILFPRERFMFWLDAGMWMHGFMRMENLLEMQPTEGFHASRGRAARGWHGIGIDAVLPFPGYVITGALFGGDRDSVQSTLATYLAVLDELIDLGCMPLEEDILTIMHARDGLPLKVHESFDLLALNA